MSEIKNKVAELNQMILEGKALEAFEKFYHDDIVMQENSGEPTIGKDANRKREEEFFGNIIEFRGAQAHCVNVGENSSAVEWSFDYTHKEWGERNYRQVCVQDWKDGQIIAERFYYGQ